MKSIYFKRDKELIFFCEMIFHLYQEIHVQWKQNTHWGNELQFTNRAFSMQQLIPIFVELFICYRLDDQLQDIIQKDYLYTDDAEIEHICELTKWLMADKKVAKSLFTPQITMADFIEEIFTQHIHHDRPIHFDALLIFCMNPLTNRLVDAVGAGIDELKREEEHQSFIQTVREYVANRKSKQSVLYMLQDETFQFYKETGKPYSSIELKQLMQKEALYILGLDENETIISPVLTLLPEKIYLFGDDPEDPNTIALLSMFQERVKLLPLAEFPFSTRFN